MTLKAPHYLMYNELNTFIGGPSPADIIEYMIVI